jgi:hypothetical protein
MGHLGLGVHQSMLPQSSSESGTLNCLTAVSGLVSHRKAPGSNLASWQIVWLIQAAIAVRQSFVRGALKIIY